MERKRRGQGLCGAAERGAGESDGDVMHVVELKFEFCQAQINYYSACLPACPCVALALRCLPALLGLRASSVAPLPSPLRLSLTRGALLAAGVCWRPWHAPRHA